jgi:hypothetical protein
VPAAVIREMIRAKQKVRLAGVSAKLKQQLESTGDGRGISLCFLAVRREKISPKHVSAKQN